MTKKDFLKTYYFTFNIVKQESAVLVVITGVIERKSHKVMDTLTTTFDIPTGEVWINDGDSDKLIKEWDWATYIDQVKRFQLDYFVKRYGIEKFVPLNAEKNMEIGELYK